MMFQVDVLIPFHRNDEFVRASILSAHSSSDVTVRVIAINDTGLEISSHDLGLLNGDLLIKTTSRGYLNAMRVGVESSTAEYVCFLDSDDLIAETKLIEQINYMHRYDFDFVSCDLAKIDQNGSPRKSHRIFGKIPFSHNPRELWLIGTHGADSSLMCKGAALRSSWPSHSKFSAHFADYAWGLSLPNTISLGHLPIALYYYRSHPLQISRNVSLGQSWTPVHELWVANFRKCFPKIGYPFEISEDVSISLAFPAALKSLKRQDRRILKTLITSVLQEIEMQKNEEWKNWRKTLYRRGLIATRGRVFRYWSEAIPMAIVLMLELINGINTRRIKQS